MQFKVNSRRIFSARACKDLVTGLIMRQDQLLFILHQGGKKILLAISYLQVVCENICAQCLCSVDSTGVNSRTTFPEVKKSN